VVMNVFIFISMVRAFNSSAALWQRERPGLRCRKDSRLPSRDAVTLITVRRDEFSIRLERRNSRQAAETNKPGLQKLVSKVRDGIEFSEHIEGNGADIFKAACELGHEGIVAKRKDPGKPPPGFCRRLVAFDAKGHAFAQIFCLGVCWRLERCDRRTEHRWLGPIRRLPGALDYEGIKVWRRKVDWFDEDSRVTVLVISKGAQRYEPMRVRVLEHGHHESFATSSGVSGEAAESTDRSCCRRLSARPYEIAIVGVHRGATPRMRVANAMTAVRSAREATNQKRRLLFCGAFG
jgi:hypothetical protein